MSMYLKIYSCIYFLLLSIKRRFLVTRFMRKLERRSDVICRFYAELVKCLGEKNTVQILRANDNAGIFEKIGNGIPITRRDFINYLRIYRPQAFIFPPHTGIPWMMDNDDCFERVEEFLRSNLFLIEKLEVPEYIYDRIRVHMVATLVKNHRWAGTRKMFRDHDNFGICYQLCAKKDDFGIVIPSLCAMAINSMISLEDYRIFTEVSRTG